MTNSGFLRTPILLGESGARVERITLAGGGTWIEKFGLMAEIEQEVDVLRWCAGRLPVARVLHQEDGFLRMSDLPGRPLTELSVVEACAVMAEALEMIHATPAADCLFSANWDSRVRDAALRVDAGLVDGSDFGE